MHTSSSLAKAARKVGDAVTKRTIVLHMDINRTIIQTDPAGGKTLDDVLNSNVAARVFGRNNAGTFEVTGSGFDSVESPPGAMTYGDFVDAVVQIPSEMTSGSAEEKREIWKGVSASRRRLLHSFTHSTSVGAEFAHHVDVQRDALAETLARGMHIVPSFFNLVNRLSDLEWPFVLIFRTFGNDITKVLDEWNTFLQGDHLVRPSGPILAGMRDRVPQCGALFRCEQGMAIAWNRNVAVPPPPPGVDAAVLLPEEYLRSVEGGNAHAVSFHQLYDELMSKTQQGGGVLGLIDYYHYWSQHAEHRSAGKCFPVDTSPEAPFQVFFDDNIFIGDPSSIVDLRCATSGLPLSIDLEDNYCCHVLPYFAITDGDYFWNETIDRVKTQLQCEGSADAAA